MTLAEIKEVTAEFAAAAKRCIADAGFDGVEIHGRVVSSLFSLFKS